MKRIVEKQRGPTELTAKDRPAASFERFFRDEFAQLYRALVIVTRDAGEGEDLAQEAFGRLWERWERRIGRGGSSGLLIQDRLERVLPAAPADRQARQERPWSVALRLRARPSLIGGDPGSHRAEPADASSAAEGRTRVTELLGHDSGEAAAILGIRPGTVRTLVSQAKARLRDRKEEQ